MHKKVERTDDVQVLSTVVTVIVSNNDKDESGKLLNRT
jgi:hypothetical protein